MTVEINGASVAAVAREIHMANNHITGPLGCGKQMESVLNTLGNYWKSPDAVKFATGICSSINPLLRTINARLSACCSNIVKN